MILYFCTENLGSFVERRPFGSNVPVRAARRRLSFPRPFNVCTQRSVYNPFREKTKRHEQGAVKKAACALRYKIKKAARRGIIPAARRLYQIPGSASPQGAYASGRLTAAAALFTPAFLARFLPREKLSCCPTNVGDRTEGVKYRAPVQMHTRCVGRGAARALPRETVACRRQDRRVVVCAQLHRLPCVKGAVTK